MNSSNIRSILALLSPFTASGYSKIRLGDEGDGGYVVIDNFGSAGACLSLGIGDNVSFDYALAERGYDIIQFDHTVSGPPVSHERFQFNQIGVAYHDLTSGPFLTLSEIIAVYNVARYEKIILKMDVEGSEWGIIRSTPSDELARCDQICIEFHNLRYLSESDFAANAEAALRHLNQTHAPVHVHGNNWRKFSAIAGVPVPDVLEVTFLRRGFYNFLPCNEIFPGPLDFPNKPAEPDLFLGNFRFL